MGFGKVENVLLFGYGSDYGHLVTPTPTNVNHIGAILVG